MIHPFRILCLTALLGGTVPAMQAQYNAPMLGGINEDGAKVTEWYYSRGLDRKAKGDFDGALKDFNTAFKYDPKTASRYYSYRASLLEAKGDFAGAAADRQHAAEINYEDKIGPFNRAIEKNPGSAQAYEKRGLAFLEMGELKEAIADFTKAIALNPGSKTLAVELGSAREQVSAGCFRRGRQREYNGDWDGAIAAYTEAAEYRSKDEGDLLLADAHGRWAAALQAEGRWDDAIAEDTKAIERNPKSAQAYLNRGNLWKIKGDLGKAIADYTAAIDCSPQYAYAYAGRSALRQAMGDATGAAADHAKVVELDPQLALKEREQAIQAAKAVGARPPPPEPKDARICWKNGLALKAKGDFDGAIAAYNQAITLDPKFVPAYNDRGIARHHKGDQVGAIADYTRAIELNPRYPYAYYNRGVERRDKGDQAGAIADFTKAIECNPKYAHAYEGRSTARRATGDLEGASADYAKSLELSSAAAGSN